MPEHTIAENLTRLQNAKTAIGNAITTKGGTVAAGDGLEEFATDIGTITNQYTAGDEGKVVNGGTLVSQTSTTATSNGTINTTTNNEVVVNVPNTYTAGDEGKVVSNSTLVAQTAYPSTITENGTYNTTYNNSITVNVPSLPSGIEMVQLTPASSSSTYIKDSKMYAVNFADQTIVFGYMKTIASGSMNFNFPDTFTFSFTNAKDYFSITSPTQSSVTYYQTAYYPYSVDVQNKIVTLPSQATVVAYYIFYFY